MMRSQKGFTLLEVAIAVAITAFLMVAVYGVFFSTSRARAKVEESSGRFHQARVFFERISRELRGSIWSSKDSAAFFICRVEDNNFKEILFTTAPNAALGPLVADGVTARYTLEKDAGDLHTLYRAVSGAEGSVDSEDSRYIIVENISGMGLRFFREGAWFEKWNSEDVKQLPRLVEISLKIQSGEQELSFSTIVDIPMASM
jgi:prepilin-type N-terminal cleavage/methylation domain-containing protein